MSNENETSAPEGQEVALLVFANDRSEQHLGVLRGLLKMVYHAALTNQIAVMQAFNKETGEEEVVLVGVQQDAEGNVQCYPLFVPLRAEDVDKYVAPNGKGGWVDEATPEDVGVLEA